MVERVLRNGTVDRIAMAISGLCLVHCAATAVLLGLVSSAGALLGNPAIHEGGLALATLLGAIALGAGWRAHRLTLPAATGGAGLVSMAAALAMPHGGWEIALTMAGVALLAFGHHLNRQGRA